MWDRRVFLVLGLVVGICWAADIGDVRPNVYGDAELYCRLFIRFREDLRTALSEALIGAI